MKGKILAGVGYAFVTFRNEDLPVKAIKETHNSKLKDKSMKCSHSQAKHLLVISWGEVCDRNWVPGWNCKRTNITPAATVALQFVEYYNSAWSAYSLFLSATACDAANHSSTTSGRSNNDGGSMDPGMAAVTDTAAMTGVVGRMEEGIAVVIMSDRNRGLVQRCCPF
ncbi:hypothetical protein MKW98_019936 [Papaver atlanticum]|uniref:RRM domain-containing protein n=1 Tax=Papaver atlanticum TaxID=357466 RepID=A0AAD4S1G5_9MAGN|nr:hypothetical protein MKW98_019936 [Papaver atlanticum]